MDLFFILLILNLIRDSIGTYFLFPEEVNFTQAVQTCSSINATVLFIDDFTEDTYIKNTYLPLVTTAIWLAIYDIIGNETNVNYYTNQTLNYTNWAIDNSDENCFRYVKNQNWWDVYCYFLYSTLCEFSTIQTEFTETNVTATTTIPETTIIHETTITQSPDIATTQTTFSVSNIMNTLTTTTIPETTIIHETTITQSPAIATTQTTFSVSSIMKIPLWNEWNSWSFCLLYRQRNNTNMTNGIENEILNVSCSLVCEHSVLI
jgi:hypothetical protein